MGVFAKLNRARSRRQSHSATLDHDAFTAGRILFVSHEATRTGAPKIILNIIKHFHEKTNAKLHTILHNGGFLREQFSLYSDVDCLNIPRESTHGLSKKVRKLGAQIRHDPPVLAICNSMESRYIAYELTKLNVPILFLVHELPSSYQEDDYRRVYDCSQRVIFPVRTVRDAADEIVPIPENKGMVLSQGLLNAQFGTGITKSTARTQIRRELSLPEDAHIVLGCGTLDLRKGIDHFAAVARSMLSNNKLGCPVHFVWLGEGPRWTHSPFHYVMLDIKKSAANGHVHFIGEREDVEPYFMGADAFLMTSRVDPFPCVLHEAMAAELPIITFENSGGACEAIGEGAGLVVPFGDHQAMVDMIVMLASQPAIAENMRRRAYERVSTRYQFDQYVNRLIRLAEQTANRKFSIVNLDTTHDLPRPTADDELRRAA